MYYCVGGVWSGGEWGQLQLNGLLDVDGSNRPFQSTAVQPAVKKSLPNGNASTIKEFQAKPNQTNNHCPLHGRPYCIAVAECWLHIVVGG